jgi:hypothetical protein
LKPPKRVVGQTSIEFSIECSIEYFISSSACYLNLPAMNSTRPVAFVN